MKNSDLIKDILIDKYYKENLNDKALDIEDAKDCSIFNEKLNRSIDMMSINEKITDFDVDISRIIDMAEGIKRKRKNKFETIVFILSSIIILLSFNGGLILLGEKFLLYFQIFIFFNMPLIIFPIIIKRDSRRDRI